MRYVFQTYLKSTLQCFSIYHLQEDTQQTGDHYSLSQFYRKYKREKFISLICIDNHLLGLFYEEY